MRRRPSSLVVLLWPRGPSSIAPAGQMRVRRPERHLRKTPSRLSRVWPVEKARLKHRENVGPSVHGSWRDSHPQRHTVGHERASPSNG